MSGLYLVQNVASFNSIRCRRSRCLPLRMKGPGPKKSSWHPHRANNGPSTAIGAIRPSNHSIERDFCFKTYSGGWQSRAMSSLAAPAPWKPSEASRNCCMAEENLSVADKDLSVSLIAKRRKESISSSGCHSRTVLGATCSRNKCFSKWNQPSSVLL